MTVAPEGIWYKCHRDKCGLAGLREGLEPGTNTERPAFNPRPYPYDLSAPRMEHWLWDKLDAEPSLMRAAWLGVYVRRDREEELVWEVRDYDWRSRGHVSRSYPSKRIATWRVEEGPFVAFFGPRCPRLWIVEDPVSAARIALAGHSALALLGTHLSTDARAELGRYLKRLDKPLVRVALDPDAAETGAKMTRDLTFRLGCDTIFVPLKHDIKDLLREDFEELMK